MVQLKQKKVRLHRPPKDKSASHQQPEPFVFFDRQRKRVIAPKNLSNRAKKQITCLFKNRECEFLDKKEFQKRYVASVPEKYRNIPLPGSPEDLNKIDCVYVQRVAFLDRKKKVIIALKGISSSFKEYLKNKYGINKFEYCGRKEFEKLARIHATDQIRKQVIGDNNIVNKEAAIKENVAQNKKKAVKYLREIFLLSEKEAESEIQKFLQE